MNQTPPSTFHTCLSPLLTLTCYISAPLPRNPEKKQDFEVLAIFSSAGANYLFSDRHVELVLGQVLDLAGFEAGNLPPHAHHARVSADIGDVSSAVSVQLSPDGPEIQSLLRLHFFQIDLQ